MSCLAENAKWQRASPWGSFNHGSLWLLPAALVIINQALTNCSATAPAADAAAAVAAREVALLGIWLPLPALLVPPELRPRRLTEKTTNLHKYATNHSCTPQVSHQRRATKTKTNARASLRSLPICTSCISLPSSPPFPCSLSLVPFLVVGVWSVASVTDERQLLKMHEKHKLIFYPHFRCN